MKWTLEQRHGMSVSNSEIISHATDKQHYYVSVTDRVTTRRMRSPMIEIIQANFEIETKLCAGGFGRFPPIGRNHFITALLMLGIRATYCQFTGWFNFKLCTRFYIFEINQMLPNSFNRWQFVLCDEFSHFNFYSSFIVVSYLEQLK